VPFVRFFMGFVLGVALTVTVVYSGTMQWLPAYLSSRSGEYAAPPPPVAAAPVRPPSVAPPPVAPQTYPGRTDTPAPISPAGSERDTRSDPPDRRRPGTFEARVPRSPSGAPDREAPPFKVHVSLGARGAGEVAGCFPAYTLFNETSRPVVLLQGRRGRNGDFDGRSRGDVVVEPGDEEVGCTDVSRDRSSNGTRRLDYTNPYPDPYAPRTQAPAPTVNIHIEE
jgi:hypothetical protein